VLGDAHAVQAFPIACECARGPLKAAVPERPLQRLAFPSSPSQSDVPPMGADAGVGLGQETSHDGFRNDWTSLPAFALQQEASLCSAPKQHLKCHNYDFQVGFFSALEV